MSPVGVRGLALPLGALSLDAVVRGVDSPERTVLVVVGSRRDSGMRDGVPSSGNTWTFN